MSCFLHIFQPVASPLSCARLFLKGFTNEPDLCELMQMNDRDILRLFALLLSLHTSVEHGCAKKTQKLEQMESFVYTVHRVVIISFFR